MPLAARLVALLSLASLVLALSSPCPPPADPEASGLAREHPHSHGQDLGAAPAASAAKQPHVVGCARKAPRAVLVAPCRCGCGERPHAAAGVVLELAHSLVSRAPALLAPPSLRLATRPRAAPPDRIGTRIDHVPLAV